MSEHHQHTEGTDGTQTAPVAHPAHVSGTPETPVELKTETQKEKETPPPPCHIKVARNEVEMPFKNFKILKGKRADTYYPAVEVTAANRSLVEKWMGESNLLNVLQTYLKRTFQAIAKVSVSNETGLFEDALFIKYAEDFSVSSMKLSEINNKLDELTAQMTRFIDSDDWMTNPVKQKELQDLNKQVLAYKQMKDDKKRPTPDDEEEQPAVVAE